MLTKQASSSSLIPWSAVPTRCSSRPKPPRTEKRRPWKQMSPLQPMPRCRPVIYLQIRPCDTCIRLRHVRFTTHVDTDSDRVAGEKDLRPAQRHLNVLWFLPDSSTPVSRLVIQKERRERIWAELGTLVSVEAGRHAADVEPPLLALKVVDQGVSVGSWH